MKNTHRIFLKIVRFETCRQFFLAGILVCGCSSYAAAQDWRFEPIIKVGGEIEDNATLNVRTDQEVGLEGYLLDLKADINFDSPQSTFFLQPRFLLRNYPDEPDFDSDDIFIRANYRYDGVKNAYGFRANYDRESVRTAERTDSDLDIEDPDEIPDTDSGRILRFGDRERLRIVPYWDYQFTNKSSFGAKFAYVDVQYEEVFAGFLSDFTDARIDLSYKYTLSPVTNALFTATTRQFDSADSPNDIKGFGVLGGVEHVWSEKTRISAMIGLEDTDQPGIDPDPEVVGNATLRRDLETIRMFLQYRRSITASGAGNLSVRDTVNLNFRRRLSEKISAGIGVRAYQSRGKGEAPTIDDRNYFQLQASFSWYLARFLAIEADYRYTVLDRSEALGESSNSNRINLWFVYQPNTVPDI